MSKVNRHKENGRWVYDDDDGRSIADMSGVERRNLILPRLPIDDSEEPRPSIEADDGIIYDADEAQPRPWEVQRSLDRKETGAYILGATAAGLLLVLIFIGAGAAVIGLMLYFWT